MNGRLKKWEFVTLHVLVIVNILALLLALLTYFVFVPLILQDKIDHFGEGSAPPRLHEMKLGKMSESGLEFSINATLDAILPLPVKGGLAAMSVDVFRHDKRLVTLNLPTLDFWLNKDIDLATSGSIAIDTDAQENLHQLIQEFSSPDGLDAFNAVARFKAPVRLFGVQIYAGIPLHKEIPVKPLKPDLELLLKALKPLIDMLLTHKPDTELREKYSPDDIFNVNDNLGIVAKSANIPMNDNGAGIKAVASFVNPTYLSVHPVNSLELFLALEGAKFAHVKMNNLALSLGLQDDMALDVQIDLIHDSIDPAKVREAIHTATDKFADDGHFNMAVAGPISISGGDFVQAITSPLMLNVPVADILSKMLAKNSTLFSQILSEAGVKNILGNSTIDLNVASDRIETTAGLVLPKLFPIPKTFSFPYGITTSLYGGPQKTIQVDIGALHVIRTSNAIIANTTVAVLPENSDAAATALASALNPVLGLVPQKSEVGIRDFGFFPVMSNGTARKNFAWCDLLSAAHTIRFVLPAIDKASLIDTISSMSPTSSHSVQKRDPSSSSLPFKIKNMQVNQLSEAPGFEAKGSVDVTYPAGLPQLSVNTGFFSIGLTVDKADMVGIEMPTGLQFYPKAQGTNIDANAILSRDPNFSVSAQKLVDIVMHTDAPSTGVGINGLRFGNSATQNIVTFSKIAMQADSKMLMDKLDLNSMMSSFSLSKLLPAGTLKLEGGDLAVESSSDVTLGFQSTIKNPLNIGLSMGAVSLDFLLDDNTLVKLGLPPINLPADSGPFKSEVAMKLSNGDNGLSDKVSSVAAAFLNKDPAISILAGITSLRLVPQGSNSNAVIDQLSPLKIQVAVSKFTSASFPSLTSSDSPIDLSAVMPSSDIIDKLDVKAHFVQLVVQPQAKIALGGDAGYNNPLPLSAKVPFLSSSVKLNNEAALDAAITGISLQRVNGAIQLRVNTQFHNGGSTPDNMNSLVNGFLDGGLSTSIAISNIYFGGSSSDRNNLLSAVNLDISSMAADFASQHGPSMKSKISDMVHSALSGGSSSSSNSDGLMSFDGPMGISATINGMDVQLQPNSVMNTGIQAAANIPFQVMVDVPFLAAALNLNDIHFVDLGLTGTKLEGNGKVALSNAARIAINDIDSIADAVAALAQAFTNGDPLPGSIGGGNILLGVSPSDTIDAFSKVAASLSTKSLGDMMHTISSKINVSSLLNKVDLKLEEMQLQALPQRALQASASASLQNDFHITLQGIGYLGASAGLDGINVVDITSPGMNIGGGVNNVNIAGKLAFPSSGEIQDKVASFGNHLSDNGLGHTDELFTVARPVFGVSESDHIKILSKAVIGLSSSSILNHDNFESMMKIIKNMAHESSLNMSSIISSFKLNKAGVNFNPSKTMDVSAACGVDIPIKAKIDMPFFEGGINFGRDKPFVDAHAFPMDLKSFSNIQMKSQMTFHDTDAVADNIAAVASAFFDKKDLPGKIGGGQLRFGLDDANAIDTFSKISIDTELNPLWQKLQPSDGQSPFHINFTKIIDSFGLKLQDIQAKTVPGAAMDTSLSAGFDNSYEITVTNLGVLEASAGMDNIEILHLKASGVDIKPGANTAKLNALISFLHAQDIQAKVAEFANDLIDKGIGNTPQALSMSGAKFGYDDANAFRFLSKAALSVASSKVLTNSTMDFLLSSVGMSGDSKPTMDSLMSNLDIRRVNMDMSPQDVIAFDAEVGLKNLSFTATLDIGFAGLGAAINRAPLANVAVSSGLSVKSVDGIVVLKLSTQLQLAEGEDAQTNLALLVDAISDSNGVDPPKNFKSIMGVTSLNFGASSSDVIDTFNQASVGMDISRFIPKVKAQVKKIVNFIFSNTTEPISDSSINFKVNDLIVDVHDELTAMVDVKVTMINLPGEITMNMPWAQGGFIVDREHMLIAKITNGKLVNNVFTCRAFAEVEHNTRLATHVLEMFGNVIFHRAQTITDIAGVNALSFGPSEGKQYKTFNKVVIEMEMNGILQEAHQWQDRVNPLVLRDINSKVSPKGIDAVVSCDVSPFPITMRTPVAYGKLSYQIAGKGDMFYLADITFEKFVFEQNKNITFDLGVHPDLDPVHGIIHPLEEAITYILQWQDFAQHARIGYLRLVGTNGIAFRAWDEAYFQAPDLYLWKPFSIGIIGENPFKNIKHGLLLPFGMSLKFPNVGPLQLDAGKVQLLVKYQNGKNFLEAGTLKELTILNWLHGGLDGKKNPVNSDFSVNIPWRDFNPVNFFKGLIGLFEKKYDKIVISIEQDGQQIEWVSIIADALSKGGHLDFTNKMIGACIANTKFKLFGIPIPLSKLPGFRKFKHAADAYLASFPPGTIEFH